MDFGTSHLTNRRNSEEEKKSFSASLSDGTSKFFTSMIAKKNGLFSDVSSKFDSLMKSGASSSASSESSSPTSSPPPRTPPPRPPPISRTVVGKGIKERENVATKMSDSKPVHKAGSSSGFSDTSSNDEHLVMNGMNVSFDEPLYNKRETPLGKTSETDSGYRAGEEKQQETSRYTVSGDKLVNGNRDMSQFRSENCTVCVGSQQKTEVKTEKRAPKLTTLKRRSSTVDEMLFDDYVEPESDPAGHGNGDSVFFSDQNHSPPGDLISFDMDDRNTGVDKTSCHPSQSSSESSEGDINGHNFYATTSVDSSDAEFGGVQLHRSQSMGSEKSWSSTYSIDSQPDEITLECLEFMKSFVDKIFNTSGDISQTEKAKFGELSQHAPGRLWFSRYVNSQRVHSKKVDEQIFFRLVQYFAVCLFECNEAEDFSPAKTLMNMCFTFYHEGHQQPQQPDVEYKHFLYSYLRDQPIWQSLRFWNAAFFDAVQCERAHRPMPTIDDGSDARTDDRQFQENITFGQLGASTDAARQC